MFQRGVRDGVVRDVSTGNGGRPNTNTLISLSPRSWAISGSSVGSRPQLLHAAASRLIATLRETLLVSCNDSRRTLWADAHSYSLTPLRG